MSNQTHREGSFSSQNTSEREWLSWNETKWNETLWMRGQQMHSLNNLYIYMLLHFSKPPEFLSSKANWLCIFHCCQSS